MVLHLSDSMSLVELVMKFRPLKFIFLTVVLENGQFKVSYLYSCFSQDFVADLQIYMQG